MRAAIYKIVSFLYLFHLTVFAIGANRLNADIERLNYFTTPPIVSTLRDSAENAINYVKRNNAWISVIGASKSFPNTFGMQKVINGTSYELVFSNIDFSKTIATSRVFARVTLPQTNVDGIHKAIYFQGFVNLSRSGGLISDGKLQLIGNDTILSNNHLNVVLNGIIPNEASNSNRTSFFEFDCNGYKALNINADVALSTNYYTPVSDSINLPLENGRAVRANFNKIIPIWDSLFVTNLSFSNPFIVKNIKKYVFKINGASLDLSDFKNPTNTDNFSNYINTAMNDLPNTWKGISCSNMDITLPPWFKIKNRNSRIKLNTNFAVLDESGFTTRLKNNNIIGRNEGDAHGWSFGVDSLELNIDKNVIGNGMFMGKIILPIENRDAPDPGIAYYGEIYDTTYKVVVGKNGFGSIKAEIWKANLEIDNSSTLTMAIKNDQFYPKLVLSGNFGFHSDGTKNQIIQSKKEREQNNQPSYYTIDDVSFEELTLQSERPYLRIKSLSAGAALKISSFEASIAINYNENKKPSGAELNKEYSALEFFGTMSFQNGKFSGGLDFTVFSEYDSAQNIWAFHSVRLNSIAVSADFGKAGFSGSLDLFKDDPVYGNGFSGSATLRVAAIEVSSSIMMGKYNDPVSGRNDYTYWSVDASVRGLNINLDGIIIDGFSGGLSYHMDVTDEPNDHFLSGVTYKPSRDIFLRVRAGVFLFIGSQNAFSGWAGMEFVFNSSDGISKISLSGTGQLLSTGIDKANTTIKPTTRGRRNAISISPKSAVEGPDNSVLQSQGGSRNLNAAQPMPNGGTIQRSNGVEDLNAYAEQKQRESQQAANAEYMSAFEAYMKDPVNNRPPSKAGPQAYMHQPNGAFMWGDFYTEMDITNKQFILNMEVYANYQQYIEGAGENDLLGSLDLLISEKKWHMYVGTKEKPNGLKINLKYLMNASVTSYFQMGNDINDSAKSSARIDFALRYGLGFSFNADYNFGMIYANANAKINLDMYAQRSPDMQCNGDWAGIYGWYGKADLSARLAVKAGVDIPGFDVLGYHLDGIKEEILNASVDATLKVRGPHPIYIGGNLKMHYKVGFTGFSLEDDFNAVFSTGQFCALDANDIPPVGSNINLEQMAKDKANELGDTFKNACKSAGRALAEGAKEVANTIKDGWCGTIGWGCD